ncbi:MAG: AAA family ATPase, partial [Chlamydiia bacterium]|nr:AAA family ATPase [Chlamydiia bacterium]
KFGKYSIFFFFLEMAFIPLDAEAKIKGKASVDVVGSRLGKAGSSWTQALLIEFFGLGSVLNISNIMLPIIVLIIAAWMFSLRSLNKSFSSLSEEADQKAVS